MALDKHPNSVIAKNVPVLSTIILNGLDLRRITVVATPTLTADHQKSLDEIEQTVSESALKMIYKLNDAVFRPVFSQLVDWSAGSATTVPNATSLAKSDVQGRTLRQISVYGFLQTFFDTLKGVVAGYASYIVDNAVALLASTTADAGALKDAAQKELRRRVLRTLAKCFEHDQQGFWQAPAHFSAVQPVLVQQFLHAASADDETTQACLIPAVVELAAAADSKEHHKELNGALLKLLRNEKAAVRIGVIRCQQALTARLGEEWLATLPEMLPYISELQDDDDETVDMENSKWIVGIEEILGESLDSMLH